MILMKHFHPFDIRLKYDCWFDDPQSQALEKRKFHFRSES